jgi:uncharacterized SAM-binding protein YcdF (DUF218 family)
MTLSYSLLMPPMVLLVVIPAGLLIALRWRRTGIAITVLAWAALYALCTPYVSTALIVALERRVPPASPAEIAGAQAIAVLGGDVYHGKLGGVPDDAGPLSLERIRTAAQLYRQHPLPIIITGEAEGSSDQSVAALMAQVLDQDYGIKATWLEEKAANTFENAADVAAILKPAGIDTVLVVTQAWHMPRAKWSFEHAGLHAIPAPAKRFYMGTDIDWIELLPDYSSFELSFFALHEGLGLIYYEFHYR